MLTDFQNSFTDAFCGQLAKMWLLNILTLYHSTR